MKKLILLLLLASPTLAQAPTFFYVTSAVGTNGIESNFSNQATATFAQGQHNVVLTWTASTSTVSGYNVYRGNTTGGPYTKINTALVSGLTYTDQFTLPNPPSGLAATPN